MFGEVPQQTKGINMKFFLILLIFSVLIGCAKTAPESAADTSLHQVDALHEKIKKDCPGANFDKDIAALQSSINTQLATCEAQMGELKERNNTLLAILGGLIAVILVACWGKIKGIFKWK